MTDQTRAQRQPEPDVDDILQLAAIIRKVDGNNSLGAAALAEEILSHPHSRWTADRAQRQPVPVPVSERLPGPGDCDAEGRCWWFCPEYPGEYSYWILAKEVFCDPTYCLPAHALPTPSENV